MATKNGCSLEVKHSHLNPSWEKEHTSVTRPMNESREIMTSSFNTIVKTIHTLPASEVYSSLKTRPQGLSQEEADLRLGQVGRNALQEIKGKPLYRKFLSNFTHLMAILLWIGGLIALFAQMPQLGVAVWMVNIINGVFAFWQVSQQSEHFRDIASILKSKKNELDMNYIEAWAPRLGLSSIWTGLC